MSSEACIYYLALSILPMPSRGYELSFGTLLAKVGYNGCKVFMCEEKISNLIYYFLVILFYMPVAPDG